MKSTEDSRVDLWEAIDVDGNRRIFSISREVAEKLPNWDPEGGTPPPLSIAKAAELARAAARKRYPNCHDFALSMILLKATRSCHPVVPVKWFYAFQITPGVRDNTFRGAGCEVVLMDGTVVDPEDGGKGEHG